MLRPFSGNESRPLQIQIRPLGVKTGQDPIDEIEQIVNSHLVLKETPMAVKTIGEALDLGWHIHVRCAWGKRDGMKSIRACT